MHSHSHSPFAFNIRTRTALLSLGNYCLPRFKRPFYFILLCTLHNTHTDGDRERVSNTKRESVCVCEWARRYLIFIHCTNAYFACLSCLPIIHSRSFAPPFFRHLHLPHATASRPSSCFHCVSKSAVNWTWLKCWLLITDYAVPGVKWLSVQWNGNQKTTTTEATNATCGISLFEWHPLRFQNNSKVHRISHWNQNETNKQHIYALFTQFTHFTISSFLFTAFPN